MRAGIYLGPPRGRSRPLVALLGAAAVMATLAHAALYIREVRELDVLRADVERRASEPANATVDLDDDARVTLARLRAAAEAGAPTAMSATELLQLVAGALPDDVALVSLTLEPSPPRPSLLIDAIARREEDVTRLERRIAASERVAETRLLAERSGPDGFSIRLQVDLSP